MKRDTSIADYIKSYMISFLSNKGSTIVDEIGLPIDAEWTKKLRADIFELKKNGKVVIYEVKSSMSDYKSDKKFNEYKSHCDLLYFIAPLDVAKVIKKEVSTDIGVYALHQDGYISCLRKSTDQKNDLDKDMIKDKLLIQMQYRYAKQHSKSRKILFEALSKAKP